MRIKQIKISGFGCLSDYELLPEPGITSILEDNGRGKSTLAAFIKVMFYGFSGERKSDIADNERKRYTPWNGGVFGGSIVFETGGREYRLTRLFGARPGNDSFELYNNKTMLKSADYTENIGEELFKLDAESFRRTVFISQNDIKTGPTDAISAKLGNLSGVTDDINNYEQVARRFKDKLNFLSSARATGLIKKKQNEITELENQLKAKAGNSGAITETAARLEEQKKAHHENRALAEGLGARLEEAARAEVLKTRQEQYLELCRCVKERQSVLALAAEVFPGGIPEDEELRRAQKDIRELAEAELYIASKKPSDDDRAALGRLMPVFSRNMPSDTEITHFSIISSQLAKKQEELAGLQFSEAERREFDTLSLRYSGKEDVSDFADSLIELYSDAKSKAAAIPVLEEKLASYEAEEKKRPHIRLIFLILGIVTGAAGILMFYFAGQGLKLVSTGLAGGGFACLLAGLILRLIEKPSAEDEAAEKMRENLRSELEDDRSFVLGAGEVLDEFITGFGYNYEFDRSISDLTDIKAEFKRYSVLLKKDADPRDELLAEEITQDRSALDAFLAPYEALFSADLDYSARLSTLSHEANRFASVARAEESYRELCAAFGEKKSEAERFMKNYGCDCENEKLAQGFDNLKEKYDAYRQALSEYNRALEEEKRFEASNDMTAILSFNALEEQEDVKKIKSMLTELSQQDEKLTDNISVCGNRIAMLLEEKDRLAEAEERLGLLQEECAQLVKREALIKKTASLLDTAKSSFTAKYSAPVADSFRKYYRLIEGKDENSFSFDADMNLLIDDFGSCRDIDFYSAGSRDKINLCFRMALIDAMYKSEKPVIIMDDPFVNLDAGRLEGAKKLLGALSPEYQILYLSCHESRLPQQNPGSLQKG